METAVAIKDEVIQDMNVIFKNERVTNCDQSGYLKHNLHCSTVLQNVTPSWKHLGEGTKIGMSQTLYTQMAESTCLRATHRQAKLDDVIRKNLRELGYGE